MLARLAELLVPPRCAICAAPAPPRELVCAGCARRLEAMRPLRLELAGLELTSAGAYRGVARELVAAMKFSARPRLAELAAARMQRLLPPASPPLVPVPASPARARWRGYDGAAAIVRELARRCDARLLECLERDDGPRQVGRSRASRLADPPRVRLRRGHEPLPAELCLVDDVVTTGATLGACAATLRAGGAERVCALSFARSGGPGAGGARGAAAA